MKVKRKTTMNNIISVIEGEAKYIQDSTEGHPQYRSGYLAALRAVSEFLIQQESENDTRKPRAGARTGSLGSNPLPVRCPGTGPSKEQRAQ
jgi:hypothetical protein